ncbi:MAG: 50S ribosomal protein L22 [Armatimonadetes bacterium]|nr:50S ribosomal protein L22 [Armatimonadota bacterium]
MEVKAVGKYIRVQPRKVRIVAALVKGKPAVAMVHVLQFHSSKGAFHLRKVLVSAIANAAENHGVQASELKIAKIQVDNGPTLKRMTQKAMGRGARIEKKTSHITVFVSELGDQAVVKPHGTKEKPRPKFEAPKKAKKAVEAKAEEPVVEETPVIEEVVEAPAEEVVAEVAATEEEGTK